MDLNKIMEMDHVIQIDGDLSLSEPTGIYAPEISDGELYEPNGWVLLSGWSGQYGYSGPWMHSSEFIGGMLAEHILETPGVYVAVYDPDSPDNTWAVAYRECL